MPDETGTKRHRAFRHVTVLWSNPSNYFTTVLDLVRSESRVDVIYRTAKPIPDHSVRPGSRRRDEVEDGSWISPESDLVIVGGWRDRRYLWEALRARRRGATTIIMFDTQPKPNLQYRYGRYLAGPLLRLIFHGAFVAGRRQVTVARALGFPEHAIQTGTNAAPLPELPTVPTEERRGFVLIGRLVDLKGIDVFLDAYSQYRESAPEPWPAMVIGDGPLLDELTTAAPDGVTFPGWCSHAEIVDHLAYAGCLVSSSRKEAWGVAIAEGASMCLPLIATRAAGAIEHFIEEGVNGFVVPVDDADALAAAMARIAATSPPERAQMGARSRFLAEQRTPNTWIRDLYALTGRVRGSLTR